MPSKLCFGLTLCLALALCLGAAPAAVADGAAVLPGLDLDADTPAPTVMTEADTAPVDELAVLFQEPSARADCSVPPPPPPSYCVCGQCCECARCYTLSGGIRKCLRVF